MHALTISFLQFCFPVWPSLSTIFIRSGIPGKVALAGDSNCQPCGVGFFQNKSGVSSCKACEAGRWNNETGSSSKSNCFLCPRGTYSSAQGVASRQQCNSCPPGQSSAVQGAITCTACPSGFVAKTKAETCDLCDVGTVSNDDRTACDTCELGKYGNAPGSCEFCVAGRYQDARGQTECNKCDADSYSSETGRASRSDCAACPERTTTNQTLGNTNATDCMCATTYYSAPQTSTCDPCPSPEATCTVPGVVLDQLITTPGYWREDATATIFHACSVAEDCVGGLVKDQCRYGHTGILCAVCDSDFVRIGGVCSFCDKRDAAGGFSGVAAGAALIVLIVTYKVLTRKGASQHKETKKKKKKETETESTETKTKKKTESTTKLKRAATSTIMISRMLRQPTQTNALVDAARGEVEGRMQDDVDGRVADATGDNAGGEIEVETTEVMPSSLFTRIRILIGYAQICAALDMAFEVPWPADFVKFFDYLSFVNLNMFDVLSPISPCALTTPFLSASLVHMGMLPFCGLIVLLTRSLALSCSNFTSTKHEVNSRSARVMLFAVFMLYPGALFFPPLLLLKMLS